MSNMNVSDAKSSGSRQARCSRRRFLKAAAFVSAGSTSIATGRVEHSTTTPHTTARPFWGDLHTHTILSDGNGPPEDNFEIAKSHLDFWAMTDHAYDETVFSLDYRKYASGRQLLNEAWGQVQELCRAYEQPGRFVPILGYEWTNFHYGHHNVYYPDYDQPIRMPPTLPELYTAVRNVDALVIPHHPGYPVGVCGKDWRGSHPSRRFTQYMGRRRLQRAFALCSRPEAGWVLETQEAVSRQALQPATNSASLPPATRMAIIQAPTT